MGKTLDNLYDKNVFCPFYKGTENKQVIKCEGPIKGTTVRLSFSRKDRMDEYMETYCYEKKCWECRIYEAADAKYGEEE